MVIMVLPTNVSRIVGFQGRIRELIVPFFGQASGDTISSFGRLSRTRLIACHLVVCLYPYLRSDCNDGLTTLTDVAFC